MTQARTSAIRAAERLDSVEISLIRRINALATPLTVNLGIGEPNVEPSPELRALAARVAEQGSWQYTPNAGLPLLRQQIAGSYSTAIDPATEICTTAGTQEGLYCVIHAFIGRGDEVLVPDPGFLAYPTLVRMAGGTAVPYPVEPPGWSIDVDALESLVTPKTKMILINSPANPTGGVLDQATLDRLAAIADERGILIVSDEVYAPIHYGAEPPGMTGRGRNTIVLSGLSKSHSMTGLRLGWIVANAELMRPIVTMHQYVATCASSFSQALALAVLEDRAVNESWLQRMRSEFRTQRDEAVAAVERWMDVPVQPPGGAFYLFVPVPVCTTVDLAMTLATEAAVLVIPGAAFGAGGEGFLRISFAAPVPAIRDGIERVGRFLRRH